MNILILTHMHPYPPTDGGRIVTFNTLKCDVEQGNKNTLITFDNFDNKEVKSELDKYAEVHMIPKDTQNNYFGMLKNLFSKMPYNLSKYYDLRVIDKINEVINSKKIDIVYIDHLHMAIYGQHIKRRYPKIPIILRQHNVESTIMQRFYKNQKNLFVKLYAMYQYKKLYNFEKKIVELFDKCFMITEEDSNRIKQMNNRVKEVVIPAGVDVEQYAPINIDQEENSIMFLGAMNWLPNQDAIIWFVENIFNDIKKQIPSIKFYVVGKNPSEQIKNLHDGKNIFVTGFVEDEREYIAKSKIFIVPLRIGGGMRIKILNAMAMSKCIISTSIGAEGIEVTNGEDIIICDDPQAFSEKIVEVLNIDRDVKSIGENARNTVIKKYAWSAILKRMNNEYEKLLGGKG